MPMSRPSSPPIRPPANGIGLTLAGDEARDGSVPQLMTVVDDGKKIPYGPGFYVPPPGLPASAFTDQDNMRMRSRDDAVSIEMPDRRAASSTTTLTGLSEDRQDQAQPSSQSATTSRSNPSATTRRSQLQQRPRHRCYYDLQRARSDPSPSGTLMIWAGLAVLLAASQSILLDSYDHNPASQALALASLVLALFSALVSGVGLLIATNTASTQARSRSRKNSFATSLSISMSNACGMCVCLAAALQLGSLVTYAMRSLDKAARYSVCVAFAAALLVASASIGCQLYLDGQLCFHRQTQSPRKQKGANGRHSSVTGARTPSTCPSSVSSHGGRYVPDYGLDSDTESDYMKRGIKHPHADWTDRVLDGLIHSPLLDEPKLHR